MNCSLASQSLLEVTHQDHSIGITLILLVRAQGRTQGGVGFYPPPFELDILRKLYYLRKGD